MTPAMMWIIIDELVIHNEILHLPSVLSIINYGCLWRKIIQKVVDEFTYFNDIKDKSKKYMV